MASRCTDLMKIVLRSPTMILMFITAIPKLPLIFLMASITIISLRQILTSTATDFMERLARSASNILLGATFCFVVCCHSKDMEYVMAHDHALSYDQATLLCNGKPFNGYVYETDAQGDTTAIDAFEDGLQEGKSIRMADHKIIEERW